MLLWLLLVRKRQPKNSYRTSCSDLCTNAARRHDATPISVDKRKALKLWAIRWPIRVVIWLPNEDASSCSVQHPVELLQNTLHWISTRRAGDQRPTRQDGLLRTFVKVPRAVPLESSHPKRSRSIKLSDCEFRIESDSLSNPSAGRFQSDPHRSLLIRSSTAFH